MIKGSKPGSTKPVAPGKAKTMPEESKAAKLAAGKPTPASKPAVATNRASAANQEPAAKPAAAGKSASTNSTPPSQAKAAALNPRPFPPHQQFVNKGMKPQTHGKGRIIRHQGR